MENFEHIYTRQELATLTPEEYEHHRAEILEQMREGKIR